MNALPAFFFLTQMASAAQSRIQLELDALFGVTAALGITVALAGTLAAAKIPVTVFTRLSILLGDLPQANVAFLLLGVGGVITAVAIGIAFPNSGVWALAVLLALFQLTPALAGGGIGAWAIAYSLDLFAYLGIVLTRAPSATRRMPKCRGTPAR
jgi:hypothetical protein